MIKCRCWVVMYFPVRRTHTRTSQIVPHALSHAPRFFGDRTHTRTCTRTFHYHFFIYISAIFCTILLIITQKWFSNVYLIRKGRSKTGKWRSKTENLVILFKKVWKSAIAHSMAKNEPHARTSHAPFRMLFARTSAHTSHVRRCDNTHMCAATQRLIKWF